MFIFLTIFLPSAVDDKSEEDQKQQPSFATTDLWTSSVSLYQPYEEPTVPGAPESSPTGVSRQDLEDSDWTVLTESSVKATAEQLPTNVESGTSAKSIIAQFSPELIRQILELLCDESVRSHISNEFRF